MIDTKYWKWFLLGGENGLFDIKKGKRLTAEDQTDGNTPYIGAIDSNNGLSNLIGQSPIHAGNTITLSYNGSVGEAFYQPVPYWATDDVNALYLRPKYGTLNPEKAMFVCTVLKSERYRYAYGRKWTLDNMNASKIKLPATTTGDPDWAWMESYIRSLHSKPITTKNKPENALHFDTSQWKEFKVDDVFEIINGKGITTDEISDNPGSFEAVQSGEGNNGVIGYIDKDYCRSMKYSYCEEPCLTVARTGTSGFVSFHKNGCVVGDSAKILISKDACAKTTAIYLFLQTLLSANRFKYAYGRKVTEALYKETIIKLPVLEDGRPDWQFMENYIKSLPYGDRI